LVNKTSANLHGVFLKTRACAVKNGTIGRLMLLLLPLAEANGNEIGMIESEHLLSRPNETPTRELPRIDPKYRENAQQHFSNIKLMAMALFMPNN